MMNSASVTSAQAAQCLSPPPGMIAIPDKLIRNAAHEPPPGLDIPCHLVSKTPDSKSTTVDGTESTTDGSNSECDSETRPASDTDARPTSKIPLNVAALAFVPICVAPYNTDHANARPGLSVSANLFQPSMSFNLQETNEDWTSSVGWDEHAPRNGLPRCGIQRPRRRGKRGGRKASHPQEVDDQVAA